jgi:transcription elongation factor GreA-like protein/transcription elongation GreA/GreB family factor
MSQHQGIQMSNSYLKEFETLVATHDTPAFLRLWEEYCCGDEIDANELKAILILIKNSDLAEAFGRHVEKIILLWKQLEEGPIANEVLRLIIDLETSNNDQLRELAYGYLKNRYEDKKNFNEKIRLIGIRSKEQFQGAISHFELLTHMEKGNFVFHTGGWGVGEIVDVSFLREQLSLEFDYVGGRKDLSFANAFKTLIPIPKDHFLALRFGNPDLLEKNAKDNPVEVIRILLRDLGPKTAAEIKDELCDLVIPAKEWTRWWQNTRAKIKKDPLIETPEELREPFRILSSEISHEDRLRKALELTNEPSELIQLIYSFIKDFSEILKKEEFRHFLQEKLTEILSIHKLTDAEELQFHFFLQELGGEKESTAISELIKRFHPVDEIIQKIEILSYKKRTMVEIRKNRADWQELFLSLLFTVDQSPLRDYLLSELIHSEAQRELKKKLEDLIIHPAQNPELFLWYFQKVTAQPTLPLGDQEGRSRLFESLLVLLSHLEQIGSHKELIKKIHALISNGRYLIVRQIMQGASIQEVQEFLLLATKCHSLTDHDIKILHSLAEVVHPSLIKIRKKPEGPSSESQIIWMTPEGYHKVQARIQQIATVETVETAREIETARAHGDLRENMEFKAAREKRDRLQSELKFLSDQLSKARIITRDDVSPDEVGVGAIVDCKNRRGEKVSYTLLGPWEADPDKYILSFQSKLAQMMKGLSVGEKFQFQDEEYTILNIRNYFDLSKP